MSTVKWKDNLVTSGGDIRFMKNTTSELSSHKFQELHSHKTTKSSSQITKKSNKSQNITISNTTAPNPPHGKNPQTPKSEKSKKSRKSKKSKDSEIPHINLKESELLELEESEIKAQINSPPDYTGSSEPLSVLASKMITREFSYKTRVSLILPICIGCIPSRNVFVELKGLSKRSTKV